MEMQRRILRFDGAAIVAAASVVGKYEYEGPLGDCFDLHDSTDKFGMKTWEKAESEMQRLAFNTALAKASASEREVDALFAGDLLNQCVGSSYGLLDFDIPYFGLYGACSTAAESLMLAAMMTSAGYFGTSAAVTSSHYCSAERQYRTPLEYGAQRSPTAQWTVTGAGAFLVEHGGRENAVRIVGGMPGKAMEQGINDANNMGAAMAPAAQDTLIRYFRASRTTPKDYDVIVTGDLGYEGGSILKELLMSEGIELGARYQDCGQIIFTRQTQDTHAGGSGCGCSAVVMGSYFLPKLLRGEIRRMLFLGTGAMMSPSSIQQGLAIPGIAHLLEIEAPKKRKGE